MTRKISPRDWEALSAYLDDQLKTHPRQRLETRLKGDAQFRSALEDLKRTRALLRSQPKLKAPRNFTLTAQMAGLRPGRRPAPSAFPALRLASALATIFFVIVLAGDLLTSSMQPARVSLAGAPQQAAPLMQPGMGGGGGVGAGPAESDQAATEITVEVEAAPTEAPSLAQQAPPPVEQPTPEGGEVMMKSLQDQGLEVTPVGEIAAATLASAAATEAIFAQPQPEGGEMPRGEESAEAQQQLLSEVAPRPGWSLLRFLQISLAVLALGAGLAAFYIRRSGRG